MPVGVYMYCTWRNLLEISETGTIQHRTPAANVPTDPMVTAVWWRCPLTDARQSVLGLALALLVQSSLSLPHTHFGGDASIPGIPLKTRLQQFVRNRGLSPPALARIGGDAAVTDHAAATSPPTRAGGEGGEGDRHLVEVAVRLSLAVNICLFIAKTVAAISSGSRAVLATMLDSFVDLMSQAVIFFAEWSMKRYEPEFPVGKSRLETMGVIISAGIMTFSAFSVLQTSVDDLIGAQHQVKMERMTYIILLAATLSKLGLFILCSTLKDHSASALALAEDHFNDVVSNSGAIATAAAAARYPKMWYIDPIGGGVIALYIIVSWYHVARTHIDKIVGRSAPRAFLDEVTRLTAAHHEQLALDHCRAYHFGQNYLVELEVILPSQSDSLWEAIHTCIWTYIDTHIHAYR